MWSIKLLLLILMLFPGMACAEVHVKNGGAWKSATEIHVHSGGTWQAVQEAHVKDGGTWQIVYTLYTPTGTMEFTWEYTDTTNITEYRVYLNDAVLCTVTDPAEVTVECAGPTVMPEPSRIYMTAMDSVDGETDPSNVIWAAGYPAWQASTAYALDAKVRAGDNWSFSAPMTVITAGTSGPTEPTWPVLKYISSGLHTLSASAAVDNGDDTVSLPVVGHGYVVGDNVQIDGTVNYDGLYSLPVQTAGGVDVVVITAAYVAETFVGTETVLKRSGAIVDNGNGTVNIPSIAHGFVAGNDITITGTTNYDATYTLGTQASPDNITVTATYVAEEAKGSVVDKTVTDGTITWELTYE